MTSITTRLNNTLTKINTYYGDLNSLVEINVLTEYEKYTMFNDKVETFSVLAYPNYSVYLDRIEFYYKRE
jgi:hypothetical protein